MIDFAKDVIEASHRQPVMVDFYANWCGPCRMLAPVLDGAVKSADVGIKLVKIDTDQHQDLAIQAGVTGIPDVRLFVAGRQVASFTGFRSKAEVERFVKDRLFMTGTKA